MYIYVHKHIYAYICIRIHICIYIYIQAYECKGNQMAQAPLGTKVNECARSARPERRAGSTLGLAECGRRVCGHTA